MGSPDHQVQVETDEDLLVLMSWKAEDLQIAQAACGEFYKRHSEYLFRRLIKHRDSLGDHGVEDLVLDTFRRAFEKAHTYKRTGLDASVGTRNVRAWLGAVAHNLLRDQLKHPQVVLKLVGDWEPYDEIAAPGTDSPDGAEDRLVQEALATLSDRERRIIDVTMQYYAPGEKNQRLPNGIAEELAAALETSVENLRQIRKRAFDKLREYITNARQAANKGSAI